MRMIVLAVALFTAACAGREAGPVTGALMPGVDAYQKGNFDAAILEYSRALKAAPLTAAGRARFHMNRGLAWVRKNRMDLAAADFDAALQAEPDLRPALVNRGVTALMRGDFARAEADFTRALTLQPNDAVILRVRSRARIGLKRLDDAVSDLDAALVLQPGAPNLLLMRGNTNYARGALVDAVTDFTSAIKLNPFYAAAHTGRALALAQLGLHDTALLDFDMAARLAPTDARAFLTRGRFRFMLGDFADAAEDFVTVSRLQGESAETVLWTYLSRARGKADNAQPLAERTAELAGAAWPAPLARLYLGQMTPQAVLNAATQDKPADSLARVCTAHFHIGQYRLLQGDKTGAAASFLKSGLGAMAGTQAAACALARTELAKLKSDADAKLPPIFLAPPAFTL
jgi:tetratricopeptide (TPR) repeat protein